MALASIGWVCDSVIIASRDVGQDVDIPCFHELITDGGMAYGFCICAPGAAQDGWVYC
jgi:hypothetical protein